eukprot:2791749-Amphidinium_carterae.1
MPLLCRAAQRGQGGDFPRGSPGLCADLWVGNPVSGETGPGRRASSRYYHRHLAFHGWQW